MRFLVGGSFLLLTIGLMVAACSGGADAMPGRVPNDALFADDFSGDQTGSWLLENDQFGSSRIVDGGLTIEINAPNTLQYSTLEELSIDDFDLSVDATMVAGDRAGSYGVLFRIQEAAAFYRFELTGDGRYMVERRDADGRWTRFLDDWTPTGAIFTGLNATNRLRVSAEGSKLLFYVNGELIQQVTDDAHAAGQIALDAGTFGQSGLRVVFDNLILQKP